MKKTFIEVDQDAIENTLNTGEKLCVVCNNGETILGWFHGFIQGCEPGGDWHVQGIGVCTSASAMLSSADIREDQESIYFHEIASIHIIKRSMTPVEVK